MARDLALERAWRGRIRRQAKSGLTIQAFCQQEALATHQFTWWKRELRQRDRQRPAKKSARKSRPSKHSRRQFLAVEVASPSSPGAPIEIILDTPPRIAVSPGFDPQLLRDVLRALGNESC